MAEPVSPVALLHVPHTSDVAMVGDDAFAGAGLPEGGAFAVGVAELIAWFVAGAALPDGPGVGGIVESAARILVASELASLLWVPQAARLLTRTTTNSEAEATRA